MAGDILELQKAGLTEAESRLYIELLKSGESTASELAKKTGYSRPKIYEILSKFSKIGFIDVFPIRPTIYRPRPPEIAIPSYFLSKKEELDRLSDYLISEMSRIYNKQIHDNISVWLGMGIKNSFSKIREFCIEAKEELLFFWGWCSEKEVSEFYKTLKILRKRNITIHLYLVKSGKYLDKISDKNIKLFQEIATSTHIINTDLKIDMPIPLRISMRDRKDILVTLAEFDKNELINIVSVEYNNFIYATRILLKIKENILDKIMLESHI